MTRRERVELRERLDAWLVEEALRVGPDRLQRSDAAELLISAGLSRSSAFAWVADALASGRIGRAVEQRLRESANARAEAAGISLSEDAARQVEQTLPKAPCVADAMATADQAVNVIGELARAIADTKLVREAAFADGKVRNAKMLLRAVDTMRRNLEAAVKLQQAMAELGQMERFHQAVIAEIAQESPEAAQRIVARLNATADTWSA